MAWSVVRQIGLAKMKVSIFIRVRDEAKALKKTLDGLSDQKRQPDEIVVLDNESVDESIDVASRFGALVSTISREEFSYGRALNRSLDLTKGDIVVYISAHSPPVDSQWLKELVAPIEKGEAEATFGRQQPVTGQNPFEEWFLLHTFPAKPRRWKMRIGLQRILFSNANAAILSSYLRAHPFREDLAFAEDLEWAGRVQSQGGRLLYCPQAVVWHSHPPKNIGGRMESVGMGMSQRGEGRIYRNAVACGILTGAVMGMDLVYCLFRGYWRQIGYIWQYRREYFQGLRRGLTQKHN
jgi:glycosyltransferase involved in cell wall biosynthesis